MPSTQLLLTLLVAIAAASVDAQLDGCSNDITPTGVRTTCTNGGTILPNEFDVEKLHVNLTYLEIKGEGNVAYTDAVPISYRPKLTEVSFSNFNKLSQHPRFPLHTLLDNVSHFVKVVSLYYVKLIALTAEDFHGFSDLERVLIYAGSLTSVSVDAFAELGFLPSGEKLADYQPRLESLAIWYNHELEGLDWAFLAPLSTSLKYLSAKNNGFRSELLTRSTNFTLANTAEIILDYNRLRHVPASVYETFNTQLPNLKIGLRYNSFCPNFRDEDCSCCEMAEFGKFLRKNDMTKKVDTITCGAAALGINDGEWSLGDREIHRHCQPRKPKPEK